MIWTVTDPAEIERAFAPHHEAGWSGMKVLVTGSRVWGFDGGAFIVSPQPDGSMQLHSALSPDANYAHAVDCGRKAIEQEKAAGNRLVGITPRPNLMALHFAFACGMKLGGSTEKEWVTWA